MESKSTPSQTSSRTTVSRICIDARFFARKHAGVARYTQALITNLMEVDHDNDYTVIIRPEAVDEYPKTMPKNWRVEVMDIPHYTLAEQTTLLSYLNQHKFDLVYFTMFNHPIFYRGKSIVMIHDLIMHFYPPRPLWHPRTWIYRFVMWHAAHWSDAIIHNSITTKNDVVKHLNVPEKKCHAILLAVEDSFAPVKSEDKIKEVKAKYNITKPFLFFINAWRPHKGLPELVEAFPKIKKDHDVQLIIGGKPVSQFPEIIKAVEDAKKELIDIITPGFISDEDMMTLMTASELYVNPSHYEGFGFGLLEGMACGATVLTADNACMKEIGGDGAAYFKTKSGTDLANKANDLLANKEKRDELQHKGFARIKDFSFKTMAEQTKKLFEQILKQK